MIVWEPDKGVIRKASINDLMEATYILLNLVPPGKTVTYGSLAKILGITPRLVGLFMKKNRKPVIIPCHRVVGKNGELKGYSRGGPEIKKKLLMLENVRFENDRVARDCIISLDWILDP